jgi:5'-methylthioadenosine phosphorylase
MLHRQMDCSVIGMTAATEAKLAREAEICYSSVCMVTDYDCWKKGEEVSTASVIAHLASNVANAQKLIQKAVSLIAGRSRSCKCAHALDGSVFTEPKRRNPKTARNLKLILGSR